MVGLAAACMVASMTLVSAQSVTSGSIGIRILDVPSKAQDDPRAKLYIVDHLAPGTTIDRRIEIHDGSASGSTVELYAAGASIDTDAFIGSAGRTANELSSWTSVTPGVSSIGADSTVTAVVSIRIPADASPGERYGVIWAESRAGANGDGIIEVSRVGIRMYISVGPGGAPAADFVIETLRAETGLDDHRVVVASVRNTGGRALDLSGSLELEGGPAGLRSGPFPAELGSTLPVGATGPVRVVIDARIPPGPWDTTITLHSGLIERRASASITFPDSGSGASVRVRGRSTESWRYLAAGLVALAAGAAAVRTVRSRRRARITRLLQGVPDSARSRQRTRAPPRAPRSIVGPRHHDEGDEESK